MPESGLSLSDYADAEAAEQAAEAPVEEAFVEEVAEVAEEPSTDETPDVADEPVAAEEPESDTDDEDEDVLVEYTKRGFPKPPFDPNALEGEAAVVNQHWRNVRSVDNQREKEFRKKFDGIDPESARQDKAAMDELWNENDPTYDAARRVIAARAGNPIDPTDTFALIYLDRTHPEHLKARQAVQRAVAGQEAPKQPTLARPGTLPRDVYDPETGELDAEKLAAWQTEDRKQIARLVAEKLQKQEAPPAAMPQDGDDPLIRDYNAFCAYEGIDPMQSRQDISRAFYLFQADGIQVPNGPKGLKMLWDRVKDERKSQIAKRQADDVARAKRASTSQPRSATPESGPSFHGGMTLAQRYAAEAAARGE